MKRPMLRVSLVVLVVLVAAAVATVDTAALHRAIAAGQASALIEFADGSPGPVHQPVAHTFRITRAQPFVSLAGIDSADQITTEIAKKVVKKKTTATAQRACPRTFGRPHRRCSEAWRRA